MDDIVPSELVIFLLVSFLLSRLQSSAWTWPSIDRQPQHHFRDVNDVLWIIDQVVFPYIPDAMLLVDTVSRAFKSYFSPQRQESALTSISSSTMKRMLIIQWDTTKGRVNSFPWVGLPSLRQFLTATQIYEHINFFSCFSNWFFWDHINLSFSIPY